MQGLGAGADRGVEEGAHGGAVGGDEGDVDLTVRPVVGERADPERRLLTDAVADHLPKSMIRPPPRGASTLS